ncbi:MAG: substrate-binding domain-containing protein [Candidatus Dormibacteraeota bacterium]|nr:substrate-binding domain-containing protein [Candidatus Dormibacteraeota bacterium]MBO0744479.1 substrate-binding domain-containing protein [Candidatus Dormibacteraeota bacterium]
MTAKLKWLGLAACGLLLLAACGGTTAGSPTATPRADNGTATVLYAASLEALLTNSVGPAFQNATGDTFQGQGANSGTIASGLASKTMKGDVFISAAASANAPLEGAANGNLVTWYVTFASTKLEIAYNPNSQFAKDFKSKPWYQVLQEPGIKVGRTDPTTDPKGKLTVAALQAAQSDYNLPGSFASSVQSEAQVFPEAALVGDLQSGQLDAGFFYSVEASAASISSTVSLGRAEQTAPYTITLLNNASNKKAGADFIAYLLGGDGVKEMRSVGLTVLPYQVTGPRGDIPRKIQSLLPRP